MDVGAALNVAWERTRLLLFEHRSWGRWGTFALLTFLTGGGGGGGGGGNFSIPTPPGGSDSKHSSSAAVPALAAASFAGVSGAEWAIILAVFFIVFVLVLLFMWLGGIARLVMTENIIRDRHALVEPFGRLGRLGLSSFLWQLGFGVVVVGLLLVAAGGVGGGLYLSGVFESDAALPVVLLALFVGIPAFLAWLIVVITVTNLHNEVISPVMYLRETPASGAWRLLLPNLRVRWKDWLVYLAVRVAVAIGAGMVSLFALLLGLVLVGTVVGLLVGVPTFLLYQALDALWVAILGGVVAFLLGVPALLVILYGVATPLAVFGRCYAMAGLGQCLPEFQVLGAPPAPPAPPPETGTADPQPPPGPVPPSWAEDPAAPGEGESGPADVGGSEPRPDDGSGDEGSDPPRPSWRPPDL